MVAEVSDGSDSDSEFVEDSDGVGISGSRLAVPSENVSVTAGAELIRLFDSAGRGLTVSVTTGIVLIRAFVAFSEAKILLSLTSVSCRGRN